MTQDDLGVIGPALMLSAVSGARSMTGIAALARARASAEDAVAPTVSDVPLGPRIVRRLGRRFDHRIATVTTVLAGFELMADKSPNIPDRIDPGPLAGRVIAGAIIGAAAAQMRGRDRRPMAIGGAITAFAAAHATFRLRRALSDHMPSFVAALVEDAIVVSVAAAASNLLAAAPRRVRV